MAARSFWPWIAARGGNDFATTARHDRTAFSAILGAFCEQVIVGNDHSQARDCRRSRLGIELAGRQRQVSVARRHFPGAVCRLWRDLPRGRRRQRLARRVRRFLRAVELWPFPGRSRRGHDLRPIGSALGAAGAGHGSGGDLFVPLSTEFSAGGVAARAAPRLARLRCADRGHPAALSLGNGRREMPVGGAVLLGLLTYKPQLGLLVPVALVTAGLWRTLTVAVVTAILLVVVTSLLFGGAIWPSWAAYLPAFSRQFAAESSQILHLMPTILVALLQLGVAPAMAQLAQWTATAAAVAIVWTLFRSGPRQLAAAGLLVATFLATPYTFVYDMPILATAVIWVIAERQGAGDALGTGEVLVMIFAMIAPITLVAGTSNFPLTTLALVLLLGAIVRRCRRLRPPAAAAL